MLLASMNRRSRSIPFIPVTHTLHLLSISFPLDPSVTTRYRPVTRMIFSQRDQLSSVSLFSPIFVKKQRIRLAICNLSLRYNFLRKSAQGREIKRNFYYVTRSTRGERMHPTVCPNSITCSTCPCYRYTLCFHGKCDSRTWKFQTGIAE